MKLVVLGSGLVEGKIKINSLDTYYSCNELVFNFQDECDTKEGLFHQKSDKSPPPPHDFRLEVTAAKEEKGGEAASTTEDQVPLKEEEEEDRAEEVGETRVDDRVDVLAQLFPGRPRASLGAVLRECRGDLVKALEKCTRSVEMVGFVPFIQMS